MAVHQNDEESSIAEFKSLFNGTIDIIKQILGSDAFLAVERATNEPIEKFSGSVYDSIIIPFSFFEAHELMANADRIRISIKSLKRDDEQYREDTYAATGSKKRVIGRIMTVYNLLANIIGSYTGGEERIFANSIKQKLFYNGYICSYCGNEIKNIEDAEVDHIIPFSHGGKTEINNAQLLHRHCNRKKGNAILGTDIEFEDEQEEI